MCAVEATQVLKNGCVESSLLVSYRSLSQFLLQLLLRGAFRPCLKLTIKSADQFFMLYLFLLQNPGQELGGTAERRRADWLDDHFVEPDLSVLQAAVEKTMIWTEVEACKRQVRVPRGFRRRSKQ